MKFYVLEHISGNDYSVKSIEAPSVNKAVQKMKRGSDDIKNIFTWWEWKRSKGIAGRLRNLRNAVRKREKRQARKQ